MSASAAMFAARRDELNARFAREGGELAPAAMLGYLERTVAPILDGWGGDPPAAVLLALFDLGLAGLRVGLVGDGASSRFEEVLRARMPVLASQVAAEPALVLRALGNGYLNVAPRARRAVRIARRCSTSAWCSAGVRAWPRRATPRSSAWRGSSLRW